MLLHHLPQSRLPLAITRNASYLNAQQLGCSAVGDDVEIIDSGEYSPIVYLAAGLVSGDQCWDNKYELANMRVLKVEGRQREIGATIDPA